MTTVEFDTAKRGIETIFLSFAPTGVEQQIAMRAIKDTLADMTQSYDFQIKTLTGMAYDGLAYGNWPWTVYK